MSTTKKRGAGKTGRKTTYLTKRILTSAATAGIKQAAANTMAVMGFTIVAEGAWIVKKYADGRVERIEKFKSNTRRKIVLD